MKELKKKIGNTTVLLGLCMIFTKVTSFAKDMVLSYAYGAGSVSDAYLVAVSIPTILITGIMTAVYTSYIPMYNEIKVKEEAKINKYTSNIINWVLLLAIVSLVLFFVFKKGIVYLFAAGFDENTFDLTVNLSSICIFSILFLAVLYVLQGYLQANNCFILVAFFMVPVNLIITLGIVVGYNLRNTTIMALAVVLAYAAVIPVFIYRSRKLGFRYSLQINIKDEYLKKTFIAIVPIFVGQMLAEINNIVDKNMASRLPSGYVTALDYGFKVSAIVYGILAWPIATVLYPKISAFFSEGKKEEATAAVRKSLEMVGMIIIPVTVIVVILANPIIEFLFYRGAFEEKDVQNTAQALTIYVISAIPIGYRTILEKVYYATKETKRTVVFSSIGIVVNIVLNILLLEPLGHVGLALATTCSCVVTAVCYMVWLGRYRMPHLINAEFILSLLQTLVGTLGMVVVLILLRNKLYNGIIGNVFGVFWRLAVMGGSSIVVYGMIWLLIEKMKKFVRK